MAAANLSIFIRQLTRTMAAETLGGQSDRQLVEQLLAGRDEAVFETLVRRHGPMVYRVCRRVLRQEQDAEDAFQATFMVLAQNLRTVRKHASLASWLHGVAHRVALKAKARAATHRRHERQAPAFPAGPPDEVSWGELRAVLDAELAQLPEKWRQPLILCYLEGRTQDEAAGQLGWGKNTLRRRLDEARAALGRRLRRRGVWPAALSAVLLSDCVAPAALPPGLVASTVAAAAGASAAAAGASAAASAVSAEVVALAEGVQKTMSLTKVKLAVALLATVGSLVAAAGMSAPSALPEPPPAQKKGRTPVKEPQVRDNPDKTAVALAGRWLMTLPAGFTYQVVVRPLGEQRFAVENAVRFSGVYELNEGRLILIKPKTPPEMGYEWEVRGAGELVLVAQPPVAKVGSNYLGATLKRPAHGKEPAEEPKAPKTRDLIQAASLGNVNDVKVHLRRDPEAVHRPNATGMFPIHLAAINGRGEVIQVLLRAGAGVNTPHARVQATPLQYAAAGGHLAAVRTLLDADAKVDSVDSHRRTPLMWAAWKGHGQVVQELLKCGADVNRQTKTGWTALRYAEQGGHAEAAELLRGRR